MTTIKLKVIDENIEFTSSPPVYSGDVNTIATRFEFGQGWDGFGKTAVFYREIDKPFRVMLDVNNECYIPHEVMETDGRFFFGVFGVKDNKIKTSEVVFYDIGQGIMVNTGIVPPTEEVWQQILSMYGVMVDNYNETKQMIVDETQERIEAVANEESERKQEDMKNKIELQQEIEIERQRINQLSKLEEGSTTGDAELIDIRVGGNGKTYDTAGEAVRKQYNELHDPLVEVQNAVFELGKNLFNKDTIELSKALLIDGSIVENSYTTNNFISDYIRVEYNSNYVWNDYKVGSNMCVVFYSDSKEFISAIESGGAGGLTAKGGKLITPSNARYIRLTGNISNLDIAQFEKGNITTEYEPYQKHNIVAENTNNISKLKNEYKILKPLILKADTLTDGQSLSYDAPNIKQKNIGFNANVKTMGTITLSNGKNAPYKSGYIEVTSNEVKVYRYTDKLTLLETLTHGVYLTENITIELKQLGDNTADLFIGGKNGRYEKNIFFEGCYDDIKIEISSGSYSDVFFSIYNPFYKNELWAFGDSYFDMWTIEAKELNADNFMRDAYSGRNSQGAYESLLKNLEFYTPKKILWCMGMNDADSDVSINENWKLVYDKLIELCTKKDIELILSTIPNTPTHNHSFKNDIIRKSGYRFVDISKAVGAEISTSWFESLLSSDNVHPTNEGRYVIAQTMMVEVPEIIK